MNKEEQLISTIRGFIQSFETLASHNEADREWAERNEFTRLEGWYEGRSVTYRHAADAMRDRLELVIGDK